MFRQLRIELVASLWPARRLRITGTDAGADFLLWAVGPRLCGVVHPHRLLEVPLCVGAEAGQVKVTSVGLENGLRAIAGVRAAALAGGVVGAGAGRAGDTAHLRHQERRAQLSRGSRGRRFMAGIELRFP